jgi:glutathione S-transferase
MPKLFYSPASPYARKVLAAAAEKGVAIAVVPVSVSPTNRNAEVAAANPLGKVPTLVLDDGTALFDSRVITGWIAAQPGPAVLPDGSARWAALTQEAMADGLLDAAILLRYEAMLRPEDKRSAEWMAGQMAKIDAALDAMEAAAPGLAGRVDLGTLAIGCALGYLDFRFADKGWRTGRPKLAAWADAFAARPSMVGTAPPKA